MLLYYLLPQICYLPSTELNTLFEAATRRMQCTAGHEGPIGDLSCMSIFSACFGLPTTVQLPATTWSGQIWISCWILPHFDVRTISVAWKLKKLSNIFWQKIFFLLHPLSKGVAPLCNGRRWRCRNRRVCLFKSLYIYINNMYVHLAFGFHFFLIQIYYLDIFTKSKCIKIFTTNTYIFYS